MSNRERWVVYPLLLLSLGIGARGMFFPSDELRMKHIRADELTVGKIKADDINADDIDTGRIRYQVEVHNIRPLTAPKNENAPDKPSGAK